MFAVLVALALNAGLPDDSASRVEVGHALRRGVALLLERQESLDEGGARDEWPYEGAYRVKGEIPMGYRVGGTAVCATALLEATQDDVPSPVREALERAIGFVVAAARDPALSPQFDGDYDTRGWGHAYGLGFLLRARDAGRVPGPMRADVDRAIRRLLAGLQATDIRKRGGWNYARGGDPNDSEPSSFMTASTLQFLFEAARQGEDVDREVVEHALEALDSARLPSGAFQYGIDPARRTGEGYEALQGSIGRSPVCETTLYLAGRGSIDRIRSSLDAFFEHWQWLEKRRQQPGGHAAPYFVASYYFFYAHRYAAQAIELLPEHERAEGRGRLRALLWKVRESDGGWNDQVFERGASFGTAMSMLALLAPQMPAPARWPAGARSAK